MKIDLIQTLFIKSLEEQLSKLTADFEQATSEKLHCQQEADATNKTIELANRLIGGLGSENVRWAEAVAWYIIVAHQHFSGITFFFYFKVLCNKVPLCRETFCSLQHSYHMLGASLNIIDKNCYTKYGRHL